MTRPEQNRAPATTAPGPMNIAQYIASKQRQIKAALPKHLTVERLSRIAMIAINKNPDLMKADVTSLFGAIMECAKFGLEPGIRAHLVPFWSSARSIHLVNYIADYRGLIDLARRSGEIGPFYAFAVKSNDEFHYALGLNPDLHHVPADGDRGEVTHFYAVAKAKDGSWAQFDVMTRAQIDAIRGRSKAKDNGPWVTDYEAMGMKTVVRRLCKFLPASVELQSAVIADEAAERGEQDNTSWIDGEFQVHTEATTLRDQVQRKSDTSPEPAATDVPGDAAPTLESILQQVMDANTDEDLDFARGIAKEHLKGSALKAVETAITNKAAELKEQQA